MEKLLGSLLYLEQNKNYHLLHLTIYWKPLLSLFLNLYEPKENAVDKVSVALDQMNIKGERMLCVFRNQTTEF